MFICIYFAATCVFLKRYSNAVAGSGDTFYPLSSIRPSVSYTKQFPTTISDVLDSSGAFLNLPIMF